MLPLQRESLGKREIHLGEKGVGGLEDWMEDFGMILKTSILASLCVGFNLKCVLRRSFAFSDDSFCSE